MRPVAVICGFMVLLSSCDLETEPSGPVQDLRGTWTYTGSQALPPLTLSGNLNIIRQSGDVIEGSLGWTESDGVTAVVVRSGSVAGLVVGTTDADFDVSLDAETRRHLARISTNGDTLVGVWIASGGTTSGNFIARRSAP